MKKLIKGCRDLDRKSQREMVNHLSPYLYVICRRYANNHQDAQDILQDALISIFNHIDQCHSNEENQFKAWCKTIAIRTALQKKRKTTRVMTVAHSIKDDDTSHSEAPAIISQLNVQDILKLLQQLPENQRLVFNLSILDGYSHKEIASQLGIKESSSRTFLVRARQSLQQLIQSHSLPQKKSINL